ncbi:ATP-dependent DNA helicase RecQ [Alkalispirochaeta americana]|uniref:DNA helicase RecQ n=1 Tax=Alkalispirochaeta americana TaxID=159291 RepID=A0A1N6SVV3_9SPIO|nr:DNA helicase RecQ [Alkalispirochaeta americana]SIQ45144.1 ATP-dependent DNA helicase RecQ [Alkalispirochaeta americana]
MTRDLQKELRRKLKHAFGFSTFKANQEEIVQATLNGRDVFAALPTGGGKSLCYQLPALFREGITVVVSPLIALMKDQVDGARENGLAAAYLNSSQSSDAARTVWRDLAAGRVKLLYVSPERLAGAEFRDALKQFGVSAFAVDEAHCVSEWGHEFRPDYRTLRCLRTEFNTVPISAFTATATQTVQDDIVTQLELRDPLIVRAGFNRPELSYRVARKHSVEQQILDFLQDHPGEPGIIYRSTRKSTELTAEKLRAAGIDARPYHAGLPDTERGRVQEDFVRDSLQVVVATIAFGMGIDKSNVRWVLHGDLPRSLEGYYQETGRAGRDGEKADTLLLWGSQDMAIIRRHIAHMQVDEERRAAEQRLYEVLRYVETSLCRRTSLLSHFDESFPGNCGACDICLGEVEFSDYTVPAQKILSAAVRTGEVFGAHHLIDIVTGTTTERVLERRHQELPTFGVGSDHDRPWWLGLIRDLEAAYFVARHEGEGGRPGGFFLTGRGRRLLQGREHFSSARDFAPTSSPHPGMTIGSTRTLSGVSRKKSASNTPQPLRPHQEELFVCLKKFRKKLAAERGVPPYIVFSDKTLRVMAMNRPTDAQALLRCHGVGDRKLEAYGEQFLEIIRGFLSPRDVSSETSPENGEKS